MLYLEKPDNLTTSVSCSCLFLSPGLSFQDFYQQCREAFLVNSDLTLRAQLTEFRDHKLIRTKRVSPGRILVVQPLQVKKMLTCYEVRLYCFKHLGTSKGLKFCNCSSFHASNLSTPFTWIEGCRNTVCFGYSAACMSS